MTAEKFGYNMLLGLAPVAALAAASRVSNGQWDPTKTQWWNTPYEKRLVQSVSSGLWVTMGAFVLGGVLIDRFGRR